MLDRTGISKTKASLTAALVLLFLFIFICRVAAAADRASELENDISGTLAALAADAGSPKAWASSLGAGDEWYVFAARAHGGLDVSSYGPRALNALAAGAPAAVECQRFALALVAAGCGGDEFVRTTPDLTIGEGGVMSVVFGLHLANNGVCGTRTAEDIVTMLLDLRLPDGGWAVRGDFADVDVTSMAITALSPYYGVLPEVTDGVDAALRLISSKQNERGGFSSFGVENAESSAQVMIALASVGRDPEADADFTKNGTSVVDALAAYRLPDGTYSHTPDGGTNKIATIEALSALIAQKKLLTGGNTSIYIFNDTDADTTAPDTDASFDNDTQSVTTSATSTSGTLPPAENEDAPVSYKTVAVIIIVSGACVISVVLLIRRKRGAVIIVLIVAALAAVVVLIVDIQSPDEYFNDSGIDSGAGNITFSIDCSAVAGKADHIPENGVIVAAFWLGIADGDTVRDATLRVSKQRGILLDFDIAGTYLRGISGIREFDFGDTSGWVYRVNGEYPSVGCGEYTLHDGDVVEWIYTTEVVK